jgi:hypothetical protein
MTDAAATPDRLHLQFRPHDTIDHVGDPVYRDLSAAARASESLFFACDETAGIDRLTPSDNGWGNHAHFNLGEIFDLPGGPDGEMDIEGLDTDGDWLWITGSHSLKRGSPDDDDDPAEALEEMAEIDRDPNRYFIGRVPLVATEEGYAPARAGETREAAALKLKKKSSRLKKWLKKDAHLAPFLDIPSKENGFDIEGVAARGLRIWLGLRGPVLRAHAVILELEMKVTKGGYLKACRIDAKRRYRKYLIPTRGLGVRDLALDGDDLLILCGTPLAGDGPARILRWREAVSVTQSQVVPADRISTAFEPPYRGPVDHPEGMTRMEDGRWLLVYDNPDPDRLGPEDGGIDGDLVTPG